jgi:glycosyltransferase involved in cell wall biosynthesis
VTTNISFALEYSLGHITHGDNLKSALKSEPQIVPTYFDIPFENTPLPAPWSKIGPIRSNWTARASIVAYQSIKKTLNTADAAFFHTQITSIFSAGLMRRLPSIVSLDATPLQYDALGAFYNHGPGSPFLEKIKKRLNIRAFNAAKALIAWSEWTKKSLVDDYGIDPAKVTVIPPGIDLERWTFERASKVGEDVRFLFVGGDFARKGGEALLESFRQLSRKHPGSTLDIVTKSTNIQNLPLGATVHYGLKANTPELLRLYQAADVFAFPTRGDCLPLAVMEAMAAGLPVITTDVGALSEAVVDGQTGLVVKVDDVSSMTAAMEQMICDPKLRVSMSGNARGRAEEKFSAATNYRRLVDALLAIRE